MKDAFDEINDTIDHITKEMNYLRTHQVAIGFFGDRDSLTLTIVRANEYGAHIVPHNSSGKLWVPSKYAIKAYSKSVKPSDVKGLFVAPTGKSAGINDGGKYVVYFYLLDKVDIPARAFIRKAFLENQQKYRRYVKVGVENIMYNNATGKQLLSRLGRLGVSDIREQMKLWTKPGNAPLTIDNKKGQNNPLIDTGQLVKRVTWQILPIGGIE